MWRLELLFHHSNIAEQYVYFICISLPENWRDKENEAKGSEENVWRLELDKIRVYNWAGMWGERMT